MHVLLFHCTLAVDLTSGNLSKLRNLIWGACPDWFDLGLELGVEETTLRVIKQNNPEATKQCFTDMLSEWLKMANPSWEGLIAALEQPSVGHEELARKVEAEIGVNLESNTHGARGKTCIKGVRVTGGGGGGGGGAILRLH